MYRRALDPRERPHAIEHAAKELLANGVAVVTERGERRPERHHTVGAKAGMIRALNARQRRSKRPEGRPRRTTEAITSTATSADRTRARRPPPDRDLHRAAPESSPFPDARSAGNTPNPMPVSALTSPATTSTRKSTVGVSASGSEFGTSRESSGTETHPRSAMPSAPPSAAITRLSVIS